MYLRLQASMLTPGNKGIDWGSLGQSRCKPCKVFECYEACITLYTSIQLDSLPTDIVCSVLFLSLSLSLSSCPRVIVLSLPLSVCGLTPPVSHYSWASLCGTSTTHLTSSSSRDTIRWRCRFQTAAAHEHLSACLVLECYFTVKGGRISRLHR